MYCWDPCTRADQRFALMARFGCAAASPAVADISAPVSAGQDSPPEHMMMQVETNHRRRRTGGHIQLLHIKRMHGKDIAVRWIPRGRPGAAVSRFAEIRIAVRHPG